ncbi:hypothetical protein IF2G_01316 [Cordyceps javanica]|nr:hypothetical protein IF2G_01316 [Cordyceps javanica]
MPQPYKSYTLNLFGIAARQLNGSTFAAEEAQDCSPASGPLLVEKDQLVRVCECMARPQRDLKPSSGVLYWISSPKEAGGGGGGFLGAVKVIKPLEGSRASYMKSSRSQPLLSAPGAAERRRNANNVSKSASLRSYIRGSWRASQGRRAGGLVGNAISRFAKAVKWRGHEGGKEIIHQGSIRYLVGDPSSYQELQ